MRKIRRKSYINIELFSKPLLIPVIYLLGFLWADGYISYNNNHPSSVSLEIVSEDAQQIKPIIDETGVWLDYCRQRNSWKPITTYRVTNKNFATFLSSVGYASKEAGPISVLNLIPRELHKYWFRGYFDGDGCFYYCPRKYLSEFHVSGPYNQDWDFMQTLFENCDLNFDIFRYVNAKGHTSSNFRCFRKKDIIKLGNYVYGNTWDGIGLKRKFDKCIEIRDS